MDTNERILVFGCDDLTDRLLSELYGTPDEFVRCGCVGFVDFMSHANLFWRFPVRDVRRASRIAYDKIAILCDQDMQSIATRLIQEYNISPNKIVYPTYLLQSRVIQLNENSTDPEIQQTVRQLKDLPNFDIWCGYCKEPEKASKVWWDASTGLPYVWFADKKMFYPKDTAFYIVDEQLSMKGIEFEQQPGSPHLYLTDIHKVEPGDVLVDVGVCEGNFALKYADICSKIYLIESDPKWKIPLQLTFKDYMDKVVIVDKFLGDHDDDSTITLDTLLAGQRCDFLKMDIEGAEVQALQAGRQTLMNNNMKCSICAYHRHGHEEAIKQILNECGYETSVSKGHMLFSCDTEIFKWHELRHGIVYGRKIQ